jgi:succinate dehydrogenase/fumarate reductase flavoprotein subunit
MDRRKFLKGGALIAAGVAMSGVVGCSAQEAKNPAGDEPAGELPEGILLSDFEESVVELEEIIEFVDEQTYDIVVVGAGDAGIPAVLTAVEEGAHVACLQKQSVATGNGFAESCIKLDSSSEAGIARYISEWGEANGMRFNYDLFRHWVSYSGETLSWITQRAIENGIGLLPMPGMTVPNGATTRLSVRYGDGIGIAANITFTFNNAEMLPKLAEVAAGKGAVFYYSTPAVQIVRDADGAVTGVIGKGPDGHVKLNATKGVILAAGDYQCNPSLMSRYCGDDIGFLHDQLERTGDGHILGCLAGGHMVPAAHAKQVHVGLDTGNMGTSQFLWLNPQGERYFDEGCHMTEWNTAMRHEYYGDGYPRLYGFFDSLLQTKYPAEGSIELAEQFLPPEDGVLAEAADYIFKADTFEDLAEQMGLPVETTVASIKRYNELCAGGFDTDFGKNPIYMQAIDTPPYYCHLAVPHFAAVNGGVAVDGNYQVIDADLKPIPHLYAAGTNAGDICGCSNWTMPTGCSDGHCMTAGRYTVLHALTGKLESSNPCDLNDVSNYFAYEDGTFAWDKPEEMLASAPLW